MDPQGRIAVPARFRGAFTAGLVLTRAYDRCIAAYSHDQWQAHVKGSCRASNEEVYEQENAQIDLLSCI